MVLQSQNQAKSNQYLLLHLFSKETGLSLKRPFYRKLHGITIEFAKPTSVSESKAKDECTELKALTKLEPFADGTSGPVMSNAHSLADSDVATIAS